MEFENQTALEELPLYLNKLLLTCLVPLQKVELFRCEICDKLYCYEESLTNHLTTHAKERESSPLMQKPDYTNVRTYARLARSKRNVQNTNNNEADNSKLEKKPTGDKVIKSGQRTSLSLRDRITFEDDDKNDDNVSEINNLMSTNDADCFTEKSTRVTTSPKLKSYKKLHTCHICKEQFAHKISLSIHVSKHLGQVLISCDVCGLEFNNKRAMNEHKTSHSNENPYKCDSCVKSFKTKRLLKNHIHRTHSVNIYKSKKCEICGKSYKFLCELRVHQRSHTDERPYSCYICNISFRNCSSLSHHRLHVHTPKIWLTCDLCNKSMLVKSNLMNHILNHMTTGYPCHICKKQCGHPVNLARHLKNHFKIFKCSFCGKYFDSKFIWERHEMTHMKCLDFECPLCKKKFGRKDHVTRHVRKSCPQRNKES